MFSRRRRAVTVRRWQRGVGILRDRRGARCERPGLLGAAGAASSAGGGGSAPRRRCRAGRGARGSAAGGAGGGARAPAAARPRARRRRGAAAAGAGGVGGAGAVGRGRGVGAAAGAGAGVGGRGRRPRRGPARSRRDRGRRLGGGAPARPRPAGCRVGRVPPPYCHQAHQPRADDREAADEREHARDAFDRGGSTQLRVRDRRRRACGTAPRRGDVGARQRRPRGRSASGNGCDGGGAPSRN